jgi:CheY-like chemotaxis protein
MSDIKTPRILVADDDLGVIGAYRYVLEKPVTGLAGASEADALEVELFGSDVSVLAADDENWRVHFVDQGADAVAAVRAAIAKSDPFSVVFLDIRMPPGIDGYETAAQIRKLDPLVHIVFVSGYSDYSEQELLEVAGPAHRVSFLPKPVWPLQLKAEALAVCRDARLIALCKRALCARRPEQWAAS